MGGNHFNDRRRDRVGIATLKKSMLDRCCGESLILGFAQAILRPVKRDFHIPVLPQNHYSFYWAGWFYRSESVVGGLGRWRKEKKKKSFGAVPTALCTRHSSGLWIRIVSDARASIKQSRDRLTSRQLSVWCERRKNMEKCHGPHRRYM